MGQRFNFLLLFFSLIVTAAVQGRKDSALQALVLTGGAIITLLMTTAIGRTLKKLDFLLPLLSDKHPAKVTDTQKLPNGRIRFKSGRHYIGRILPWTCFCALASWAAYSWAALLIPCLALPKLD
jgi:hypothetical protein